MHEPFLVLALVYMPDRMEFRLSIIHCRLMLTCNGTQCAVVPVGDTTLGRDTNLERLEYDSSNEEKKRMQAVFLGEAQVKPPKSLVHLCREVSRAHSLKNARS